MIRHILLALSLVSLLSACNASSPRVLPGIEVLRERKFDILQGKRVGLITNPTGVDAGLVSTIDILYAAPGVTLAALYGPEHGVRGDFAAGDRVSTYTDPQTGLTVYSLYGQTRKPTPDMLKGIDVLVYDIQDIGCRSYTYISTMGLAMEAAAEQKIPFVVLDRPNPLGGKRVEGNIAEPGFFSFVSQFPIPYVYGLTCGELARLLNGEGMLSGGIRCSLTVVPMKGWKREMTFEETGLFWVPTSPHIPRASTSVYYVSTGVIGELGVTSEGVGSTLPFEVFAAEWINPAELSKRMTALGLPGVIFRPITFKPFYGRDKDKTLHGVQLHFTDASRTNLLLLQFHFLQVHHELYPDKDPFDLAHASRMTMFDKVAGTDAVRKQFQKRKKVEDVLPLLNRDGESFRAVSAQYLLY